MPKWTSTRFSKLSLQVVPYQQWFIVYVVVSFSLESLKLTMSGTTRMKSKMKFWIEEKGINKKQKNNLLKKDPSMKLSIWIMLVSLKLTSSTTYKRTLSSTKLNQNMILMRSTQEELKVTSLKVIWLCSKTGSQLRE